MIRLRLIFTALTLAVCLSGARQASAFTPAQMKEFYQNCQKWQKMSLAQRKKVVSKTRVTVAQASASCRVTLSRTLQANIRLEEEYQRAIHSGRHSSSSDSDSDGGSWAPSPEPTPSRDMYGGPNVCPDGSHGYSCTLSPDGTYHGGNLCPNGQYGDSCGVCADGSYGC